MNWMLDLLRNRQRASRILARSTGGGAPRRRQRLGIEPLEGRSLLSLSSFFSGLFPSYSSTSTKNATNAQQLKLLRQPANVSYPPYNISVGIATTSDPGATGVVFNPKVLIQGIAPAYSTVWLAYGPLGYFNSVARADSSGYYAFAATVPQGRSTLIRTFSETTAEDYSNIASVQVTSANPIVAWDAIALRAIRNANLTAEQASRDLAILHSAQYDAVAAATNPNSAFAVHAVAKPGASPEEAANAAAESVLASLFPAQSSAFWTAFSAATSGLPNDASVKDGAALGQDVGQQTIAARANDGSTITTPFGVTANPNWSLVKPFVITNASQFRPAAPPIAGTTAFDQALAEVTRLGRSNSTARTVDRTAAAQFWDDPIGTSTDAGHWNAIAEEISLARRDTLLNDARAFALLDLGLADSAIASFDAKVAYASVHPITAIETTDPTWQPLLITPLTSSYVSEHAAFGASAGEILSSAFGKQGRFTTTTNATAAQPSRTFASFAAAGLEDGNSRIYGGVNFRFDTQAGATIGVSVAKAVLTAFPKKR